MLIGGIETALQFSGIVAVPLTVLLCQTAACKIISLLKIRPPVICGALIVGASNVLLVSVCVSEVPTTAPTVPGTLLQPEEAASY